MSRAPKVCSAPGCATIVAAHKTRCPAHGGNRRTGKPRGSSRAWRTLRDQVLARARYVCKFCGAPATEVHHLEPVSEGGTHHRSNLTAICSACHLAAHRRRKT